MFKAAGSWLEAIIEQLICACARILAKQPVLRINTMIRNINRSQSIFNSRLVFVIGARAIFEGQRDYSEQTLATPTLQRMHFLRGVVNMVLVHIKVQCVKVRFFMKSRKDVYTITRITFAHNNQHSYSVLHCFVRAMIAFRIIKSLASSEQ